MQPQLSEQLTKFNQNEDGRNGRFTKENVDGQTQEVNREVNLIVP